jgi:hypothetical protein
MLVATLAKKSGIAKSLTPLLSGMRCIEGSRTQTLFEGTTNYEIKMISIALFEVTGFLGKGSAAAQAPQQDATT